jgi:hypothetical protein
MNGCGEAIVPADDFSPDVDDSACLLRSPCPLPHLPWIDAAQRADVRRLGLARARTTGQRQRLEAWLGTTARPVVIEIGAGSHVPTVRWFSETWASR